MATSDNPIAVFLIDLVGQASVNQLLGELGCTNSRLAATFTDHDLGPTGRANVTTASDTLRLLRCLHDIPDNHQVLYAMESSLQTARIPLRMPDDGSIRVAHKTGSLAGVVNDAGIVRGDGLTMSVAVLCDAQRDAATTGIDIGECVIECWRALGGPDNP
jgi:beta-lactamase class A